jgi:hypothetical protein
MWNKLDSVRLCKQESYTSITKHRMRVNLLPVMKLLAEHKKYVLLLYLCNEALVFKICCVWYPCIHDVSLQH